MSLGRIQIGDLSVSRMILGGNPFSGFSHQTPQTDDEMRHFYTTARIHQVLRQAEVLGINTHAARADNHVGRYLTEYWDSGGTIQWLAQTCPELGSLSYAVDRAVGFGAAACYLHGGMMDHLLANRRLDEVPDAIRRIRQSGLPAGIAGHNPEVFRWAEAHVDVDFYLCSYYNPTPRDRQAAHAAGAEERFEAADRAAMAELIRGLARPVIHFKVLAAGRNDPQEALAFVARQLRPQDAVSIGVYSKEHPGALEQNLQLLEAGLQKEAGLP